MSCSTLFARHINIFCLFILSSTHALADTYIEIIGHLDDHISIGNDSFLTEEHGEITVHERDAEWIGINYSGDSNSEHNYSLYFTPEPGRLLETRSYFNAKGMGARLGQIDPSIDINIRGSGRTCGDAYGEFFIYEYEPDAIPPRYAINFKQSCIANNLPGLHGAVRINSDIPRDVDQPIAHIQAVSGAIIEGTELPLDASGSRAAGSAISSYTWEQTAGPTANFSDTSVATPILTLPSDLPLGGSDISVRLYVTDTSGNVGIENLSFHVHSKSDPISYFKMASSIDDPIQASDWRTHIDNQSLITLTYANPEGFWLNTSDDGRSPHQYSLNIDAPSGETLKVGSYVNTKRFADIKVPGLSFAANSYSCSETGSFDISQIVIKDDNIAHLAGSFKLICFGLSDSLYEGEFAVNALHPSVPLAEAGQHLTVEEGTDVILDASQSSDSDGSISEYLWRTQTDIELIAPESQTVSFIAPMLSENTESASYLFTVRVTDDEGYQAEDSVTVTVIPKIEENNDGNNNGEGNGGQSSDGESSDGESNDDNNLPDNSKNQVSGGGSTSLFLYLLLIFLFCFSRKR